MKRIDKVYHQLTDLWKNSSKQEILARGGTTTTELAQIIGITRANTSLELNKLVRQGKVLKVKSFPINYLPAEKVKEVFRLPVLNYFEIDSLGTFEQKNRSKEAKLDMEDWNQGDPLKSMIGYNGSLHQAVSQAKAALMYPPHGLHMMLLGATGVGKTYFADNIFKFAKYKNIFQKDAPFITFNCADYYNNPQLLLSILFGHSKGAYTGANKEESGLVEQADGGILLLDEVHRLPPEGQEMLFYFIDRGSYHRLGESQKERHSNVLIVCATTEDVDSTMLRTFMRRIPMTITIPAIDERPLQERLELMEYLFQLETKRIKRNLSVEREVFEIILSQENIGNVGQIKSEIQLTCAQAFLNDFETEDEIRVKVINLPEQEKSSWLKVSSIKRKSIDLSNYLRRTTIFKVNNPLNGPQEDDNIYQLIAEKVGRLRKENVSDQEVQQYIMTDLHLHIKNFFRQSVKEESFSKLVEPQTVELVKKLKKIAETEMHLNFGQSFIHYFSLHLESFFQRGSKADYLLQDEIETIKKNNLTEYRVAQLFQKEIMDQINIPLPDIEVIYLTMLLISIENMNSNKKIGILVAAHGNSTAFSLVKVGKELLGGSNIDYLDMPLNVAPDEMYVRMENKIKQLEQGRGVLLLYDMGSLGMFTTQLLQDTGVKVMALSNVTTSMVLEAMRKANYLDMDLYTLSMQLKQDLLDSLKDIELENGKTKAIISVCMSGNGTAKKLKKIIEEIIKQTTTKTVKVVTVSAMKMNTEFPKLMNKYDVLAAVGTKQPSANLPFVSLEDLISGNGEAFIKALLNKATLPKLHSQLDNNVVVSQMCQETLEQNMVYLNPVLLNKMLQEWVKKLEVKLGENMENSRKIRCVVHTAFALERTLKKQELSYDEEPSSKVKQTLPMVRATLNKAVDSLNIEPSYDELCFITETVLEND